MTVITARRDVCGADEAGRAGTGSSPATARRADRAGGGRERPLRLPRRPLGAGHPQTIAPMGKEADDVLVGTVEDDGRGFDLLQARRRPSAALHLGLDTPVERVRASGGDASIATAPGEGTRV